MSDVKEPFVYFLGVKVPYDVIFVVVHPSVKILPDHVFRGRRHLKKVQLPEGLEEIGARALYDCESLEQINYPSTLIKIGYCAFFRCRSLKDVDLPEGLEEIGRNAFSGCRSLELINYPSTLIKIGREAFVGCRSLKEVDLPEGLEEIGEGAFNHCESLECIDFPSTLIKIGDYAFARCTSLTKVTLAGGVVTIGANAFPNYPSLEGVTILFKAAFVIELNSDSNSGDDVEVFTCRLVLTDGGTFALTEAKQVIISPERLNYISSPDLLELQLENTITTIMNDRGRKREENIERVLALIKSQALFEVSTILELALWKNKMDETDDSNYGSRGECRVMCGADEIIPCVLSYV